VADAARAPSRDRDHAGDLLTKGDAVATPDPPVPPSAVLARVRLGHPRLHRLVAHASRLGGRPLAALLGRLRLAASRLPL
jgi:hypothetical protein